LGCVDVLPTASRRCPAGVVDQRSRSTGYHPFVQLTVHGCLSHCCQGLDVGKGMTVAKMLILPGAR